MGNKVGFFTSELRVGKYSIMDQFKDYCIFICKELNANTPKNKYNLTSTNITHSV